VVIKIFLLFLLLYYYIMDVLLLINSNVPSNSILIDACLPNVSVILYDQDNDTYASLLEKIASLNITSFSEVGIVFDEYGSIDQPFKLLSSQIVPSILFDVEIADPTLSSWSEISGFLGELTTTYSMKTLDFFACSLYSNPSWQYVFNTLDSSLGIIIQASTDITGNVTSGGNWVMESGGVNIQGVYFNSNILAYPFIFGMTNDIIFHKNGIYWGGGQNGNSKYASSGASIALFNMATTTNVLPTFPSGFVISRIMNFGPQTALISMSTRQIVWAGQAGGYNLFPSVPPSYIPFIDIAGVSTCLIMNTNNTITVFGPNEYGQFGNGTTSTTRSTMTLPAGKTVSAIGSGWQSSYVIFTDGTIYACGYNGNGGLGDGTTVSRSTLTAMNLSGIPAGLTPIHVLAGLYSCAVVFIDASGNKSIYSCGGNIGGTFGNGTWVGSNTLVPMNMSPIAGLTILTIDYGQYTLMMICSDSSGNLSVWGVGWNAFGQLGLGNTAGYNVLTRLTLPAGLVPQALHCRNYYSAIVFTDNSLWFAGNNTGFYGMSAAILYVNYTSWTNLVPASAHPILLSDQPIARPPLINSIVGTSVSFTNDVRNIAAVTGNRYSTNSGTSWTTLTSSTTSFTITGLTLGTSYTLMMQSQNVCSGWSPSSSSQTFTACVLPTAPTISNAVGTTVYVTPPAYTGVAITNYRYQYTTDSTWATDVLTGTSATIPVAIDGLTLGTVYYIQTQAYNLLGWGPYSTPYSFTALAIPSSPVITSITNGNMQVSIAFTVGPSSISASSYTYNYSTNSGVTWLASPLTASQTSSPIIVTGLTVGSTYQFKIFAVSETGSSPESNILASSVIYTTPSPPTITSIVPGNTTAVISFTAGSSNSSAITSYQYSFITSTDNGVTWGSTWSTPFTTASGTASPITITGLTARTVYQFRIYAVNAAGLSTASLTPTVQVSAPLAPTINAVTGGSSSASINFTAPTSNNGSAITSYVYLYASSTNGGSTWSAWSTTPLPTLAGTNSPLTITGLTPPFTTPAGVTTNTVYQFKLAAVNTNGTGSFSAVSGSVTPYGPPAAPIITSIVGGNARCTIYITYPGNNGSFIPTINYSYSVNGGSWSNFVNLGNNSAVESYTFVNLNAGWNYSVMIQAVNSAGASPNSNAMSVIISSPGAPTSLTATSTGLVTASISFTAGPLNGLQTSNMVYQYSSDNGAIWSSLITRSPASIASPLLITGLASSTSYIFKLASINAAGTGQLSVASNSITTPSVYPSAPTITSVSAGTTGQVSVSFAAGSANGSAITNYKYSTDGGVTFTSAGTTASPIVISGLTNGTAYTVIMKAVNSAGDSAASSASASVTPYTNPDAPTITAVTASSEQVSVAFTAGSSNGSAITNYKYSTDSGSTYTSAGTTASPIIISGLTNGTAYTVIMKAVNLAGDSAASSASASVTPYTNPAAPTITSVSGIGSGQVSVAFTAGSSNGSAITNYKYSTDGGVTFTSAGTTASPIIISGLTNGTAYTVIMKAVNLAGDSAASTASASVTPYTNPDAPIISNIIQNTVYFSAGQTNGSAITGYRYSTNTGETWKAVSPYSTSFTVSSLTPNISYVLLLQAQNAAGWSTSTSQAISGYSSFIVPGAPTLTKDGGIVITVNSGINSSGIINYQWSIDNSNWTSMSPVKVIAPFTFIPPGLTAGTTYLIYIRAINNTSNGDSANIMVTAPSPSYTNPIATLSGTISAGALSAAVVEVTASFGTTLTAGALANTQVESVDLGEATNIGVVPAGTFQGCTELVSVILPESIYSLEENSFAGCSALSEIDIPPSVGFIGAGALAGTALESVTLTGQATVGAYAFSECIFMTTATV
jgi:hypothetical protein